MFEQGLFDPFGPWLYMDLYRDFYAISTPDSVRLVASIGAGPDQEHDRLGGSKTLRFVRSYLSAEARQTGWGSERFNLLVSPCWVKPLYLEYPGVSWSTESK